MSRLIENIRNRAGGYRAKTNLIFGLSLLVALVTRLMIIGLFWVVLIMVCLAPFCLFLWRGKLGNSVGWKADLHGYMRSLMIIMLIFVIGVFSRLFFVEIYAIPGSSMESTLVPGDKIIVNKLAYGPVLPKTTLEIPWINLLFYSFFDSTVESKKNWWDYKRLSGYTRVGEGDIVAFTKHEQDPTPYIKRCVAGPGRTLIVRDAIPLHLQNQESISGALLPVVAWTRNTGNISRRLNALKINVAAADYSSGMGNTTQLKFRTTLHVIKKVMNWVSIDSLRLSDELAVVKSPYFKSIDTSWTIYNFGPLRVPKKGMELTLNDSTLTIYGLIIEEFERASIEKRNNRFWVNGILAETYTFQQNYYFMLGDNREDSNDSRYYGLVPEKNIIGRVDWILFSNSFNGFDGDRLMVDVNNPRATIH